jgi:hypothetical protein
MEDDDSMHSIDSMESVFRHYQAMELQISDLCNMEKIARKKVLKLEEEE